MPTPARARAGRSRGLMWYDGKTSLRADTAGEGEEKMRTINISIMVMDWEVDVIKQVNDQDAALCELRDHRVYNKILTNFGQMVVDKIINEGRGE